ncbi:MAG: adenylyl-sulfate kinase [Thermoproteota archaeon]|nr:adenylyl-sulfate kinase [Thermoproteota archaeon]
MARGFVVWLTGLSGGGKTTIARTIEDALKSMNRSVVVLDGDEIRRHLSPDLGFSRRDREMNVERVAYLSHILSRSGIITIVALISPFRTSRDYARKLIGEFVEVWVKCSLETCKKRDPKGLYGKVMMGEITDFTGIDQNYEIPLNPETIVDTDKETPLQCSQRILQKLKDLGYLE